MGGRESGFGRGAVLSRTTYVLPVSSPTPLVSSHLTPKSSQLPGLQLLEELTLKNNDWPSSRCNVVTQDDMPRLRKVTFDGFTLRHYGHRYPWMPHESCMQEFMEYVPSIEEMIVNNAVVMVFQHYLVQNGRDPFRVDRELAALENCIQTVNTRDIPVHWQVAMSSLLQQHSTHHPT